MKLSNIFLDYVILIPFLCGIKKDMVHIFKLLQFRKHQQFSLC